MIRGETLSLEERLLVGAGPHFGVGLDSRRVGVLIEPLLDLAMHLGMLAGPVDPRLGWTAIDDENHCGIVHALKAPDGRTLPSGIVTGPVTRSSKSLIRQGITRSQESLQLAVFGPD